MFAFSARANTAVLSSTSTAKVSNQVLWRDENPACEVQIFEFAFSRRICCSRVCIAIRNAVFPAASRDTPIIRPGIARLNSSRQAKKAACGPP